MSVTVESACQTRSTRNYVPIWYTHTHTRTYTHTYTHIRRCIHYMCQRSQFWIDRFTHERHFSR